MNGSHQCYWLKMMCFHAGFNAPSISKSKSNEDPMLVENDVSIDANPPLLVHLLGSEVLLTGKV